MQLGASELSVLDEKELNRAIRATLWTALNAHGFTARTDRVAWRYEGGDIDVVQLQAVGQYAEETGCPPLSLSVVVACYPRYVPLDPYMPEKDGQPRPRYWHCDPFRVFLDKTLSQPWFSPFAQSRDRRMLPSFRLHRDAMKRLIDPAVHERPDIWFMRDDGSNVDENCHDVMNVVLTQGLDLLDCFHDPSRALSLIDAGTLVSATSAIANKVRRHIETYQRDGRRPAGPPLTDYTDAD
jgi:hypothetical protein